MYLNNNCILEQTMRKKKGFLKLYNIELIIIM